MTCTPLVCIVDDAADYRFILRQLFSRYFSTYSVSFFSDGIDLLDGLSKLDSLPSLVLLDRHMPTLNGHQTLLRLKQHLHYKKIPVVMMSADASADEINGCYEAGANSFLYKQIDFSLLKEQLSIVCQYWLEINQKPVEIA